MREPIGLGGAAVKHRSRPTNPGSGASNTNRTSTQSLEVMNGLGTENTWFCCGFVTFFGRSRGQLGLVHCCLLDRPPARHNPVGGEGGFVGGHLVLDEACELVAQGYNIFSVESALDFYFLSELGSN